VVLRHAFSSTNTPFARLIQSGQPDLLNGDNPPSPQVRADFSSYRTFKHLNPNERVELVKQYQCGISTYQLARQYGIHRHTVVKHLQRSGVAVREQLKMTPDVIEQATQLCESGQSLAQVGAHLGVDHGTVWRALKKRGVRMRDTHGRSR
jgi:DNA invertase Pin-like site-specific DNA recombinase